MNGRLRNFFEFRIPLISYGLLFGSLLVLYTFNESFFPLHLKTQQCGILILFFGFAIRILASATTRYLGKLKITGVYALCRQPLLLAQFISLIGLNLIVSNIYFFGISAIVFACNDCLAMKKYDKILAYHYRDIWKIYSEHTHFILPVGVRAKDVLQPSLSVNEMDSSKNTPIFLLIYAILIEIATLSNM